MQAKPGLVPALAGIGLVTGAALAEAAESGAPTARGNEPGWSLTIGGSEIEIVTDNGNARARHPKPVPQTADDTRRYVLGPQRITITLVERPCADTMSGMFFPLSVTLELPTGKLSGCGGAPSSLLTGEEWVVEEIGGKRVVPDSRVALNFDDQRAVFGNASCNNFRGSWTLTGEALSFGPIATTMMACETEALTKQEHKLTNALESVSRFEIAADGALVLLTKDGLRIVARR